MKTKVSLIGTAFILIAGTLWGFMGFFVRHLNDAGLDSIQIVFIRSLITMVCVGIFLLLKKRSLFRIRLRDLWCFIGTGFISVVLFTYFYFTTMQLTSLSVAAVLLYTAPVFVMLLSAILFKEIITTAKLIACGLAFAGCVFVSGVIGGSSVLTLAGLGTGLLAGLGYALYSIFSRYALNRQYHTLTITFYTFLISSVCVAPFCRLPLLVSAAVSSAQTLCLCILMGLVTATFPYIFYTLGLQTVESGKASTMASIEPVVATMVGYFIFHENLTVWSLIGILCVLGAIVLLNSKPIVFNRKSCP